MKPTKEQLKTINARLPAYELTAEDVEVLPFMVFDSNVTDRYTVMSTEMMRKLAKDLTDGKAAFNKLHESQTNLPLGASFAGRVTKDKELHAMMYAVIRRPDGTIFEEGKDLADRYNTGAVRACSAGVMTGFYKCSICGNDIRDYENCDHFPGQTYTIDEKPQICTATMTGHDIVNGVAEDCGIYEVSAVTAGGVVAAGIMTETFGTCKDGVDPKEFKKSVVDKGIDMRVNFSAVHQPKEKGMEKHEVEALIEAKYNPLQSENESLKKDLETKADEFAALKEGHEADILSYGVKLEEYTKQIQEYETKTSELMAQLDEAKAEVEESKGLAEYKAAYISLAVKAGVKAGEEVSEETFESKSLEEVTEAISAYEAKIDALPDGQKTTDEPEYEVSLDDSFYKA